MCRRASRAEPSQLVLETETNIPKRIQIFIIEAESHEKGTVQEIFFYHIPL